MEECACLTHGPTPNFILICACKAQLMVGSRLPAVAQKEGRRVHISG